MIRSSIMMMVGLVIFGEVFAQGLVAYYPFRKNANDISGNNFNGTVFGATLANDRADNPNYAYFFDGVGSYIDIPYDSSFYPASMSTAVWVNIESTPDSGISYILTTSGDNRTPPYDPFRMRIDAAGIVEVRYEGNFDSLRINLRSTTSLTPGEWAFIATSYNSSTGEGRLFINAVLEDYEIDMMNLDTNHIGLRIGAGQNHNRTTRIMEFFHGRIDDVRLYNRELSEMEIQQLYLEEPLVGIGDSPEMVPAKIQLKQNYPNPFNPSTHIDYTLPDAGLVTLTVYNLVGEKIRILVNQWQPAGIYSNHWDGRDNLGMEMPSGIYLYRLSVGNTIQTRKMALLR